MAIADDISVATNGDIRYTGDGSTTYTVLAFKNYLGSLLDDAQASGDDLADITTDTIYERSTDEILALNSPNNVDDTLVEHLYDGSVTQNDGDDIYSGLYVVGVVESGTEPMITQDNKVLTPYWGTGLNADAAENVIMKVMVKSRSGGADINNKKVRVRAGEFGDKYAEFDVTLGLANSTAAIFTSADLNNTTAVATVEGWTSVVNTEGFQLIDIDGNGTDEEYYAKWDKGSQTLNDTYERTKWVQRRAGIADNGTDSGSDFTVDNATILGQGQEFSARAQDEKLVEMRFKLKIGAGTPTGDMHAELFDSDDVATAAPTGTVLATSESINANRLTSTYQEVIFRFNDNYTMTANQEYFAIIRHGDGDASNYVAVQGLATTGADDGNRAEDTGTWAGVAADDVWFTVKSSPIIHGVAGELFRGITTEIVYDTESGGPFQEDEVIFWGTAITYDTLVGSFVVGEYVKFYDIGTSTVINGGKVLKNTGTILTVALEDITGSVIADGDHITGLDSGATADINVTITDDTKAGGEGILLALDDNGVDGDFYIQRISGSPPVDNLPIEGRTSAATALVNATVTARTISPEFLGQSTGSNLIGAYGIGFDPNDVGASDKFFDLSNTQRVPPNNVTFTVAGLVSGEDRVLVGPRTGTSLNKAQYTLNTTLSGATETAVVITAAIEGETPANGDGTYNSRLRIQLNSGIYKRQDYASWATSTFTIPSSNYSGDPATAPKNVFVSYIDVLADGTSEAFTGVHNTNRDLLVRVRDGGATPIKTYQTSAQFTSSAQTITINRVSDA